MNAERKGMGNKEKSYCGHKIIIMKLGNEYMRVHHTFLSAFIHFKFLFNETFVNFTLPIMNSYNLLNT